MTVGSLLYVGLVPSCAVGAVAGWVASRKGSSGRRIADALAWLLAGATVVAWGLRWSSAGHLPLFGTYESALSLAVAVFACSLVWQRWVRPGIPLSPLACAVVAGLLAHGLRYDPTVYALTISERSWAVDLHAVVAWIAFGTLTVNAGFALERLRRWQAKPGVEDALALSLSWGFLFHSAMLATGSFYKFLLFGKVWSFDPVETLGFFAWIAYGILLHLHLLAGWSGRRLAAWCLGVFVVLVVSYRGIVYFPAWSTYHVFDMDLRIHLTGAEGPMTGGKP